MRDKRLPLEQVEELMLKAAELVDAFGEEMQPLLDYWESRYKARKAATGAADRIRQMLAAA